MSELLIEIIDEAESNPSIEEAYKLIRYAAAAVHEAQGQLDDAGQLLEAAKSVLRGTSK